MKRSLRYLRIAFSAACLIACVLLIALWVRSTWYLEEYWFSLPNNHGLGICCSRHCLHIAIQDRMVNPETYIVGYVRTAQKGLLPAENWHTFLGFRAARDADIFTISIPYWFLLLTFAALPWLRWRFSVRALLIATTLAAVVLGVIVWSAS
jgi:hypothetical protein